MILAGYRRYRQRLRPRASTRPFGAGEPRHGPRPAAGVDAGPRPRVHPRCTRARADRRRSALHGRGCAGARSAPSGGASCLRAAADGDSIRVAVRRQESDTWDVRFVKVAREETTVTNERGAPLPGPGGAPASRAPPGGTDRFRGRKTSPQSSPAHQRRQTAPRPRVHLRARRRRCTNSVFSALPSSSRAQRRSTSQSCGLAGDRAGFEGVSRHPVASDRDCRSGAQAEEASAFASRLTHAGRRG